MNKSNLIMEKLEEYQAPECFVMELQNEGVLCASINDVESGGNLGTTEPLNNISLFD